MSTTISASFELDLKKFQDSLEKVARDSQESATKLQDVYANALNELEGKKLKIDIETEKADSQITALSEKIQAIGDKKAKIEIDKTSIDSGINDITAEIAKIQSKKVNLEIDDNTADAQINSLRSKLDGLQNKKAKLEIDSSSADAQVDGLKSKIATIEDKKISLQVVKGSVESEVQNVQNTLAKIKAPDNVEQVGKTMKEKILSGFKGIDDSMKGALGGVLAVAGGSLMAKGIEGVVGSMGDLIEKGKASLQATQNLETAFTTAGLKGSKLTTAVNETSVAARELSNKFALPVSTIREYSQMAASLGGATGKANTDLTMLGLGVEKATNGMVSGTMAVRLFSKGVSDPESSFALARLTKQFPALGAALKGIEDPAETTQKALAFFGPTFDKMAEQSNSPIGAMARLQNNLNYLKSSLGRVIIDGIAPFIQAFSSNIVPVIQYVIGGIKSLSDVIKPLQPLFLAAGTGLAVLVTGIFALKGVSMFANLAMDASKFALSILNTVIPAMVTETVVTDTAGVSTTTLSLAKNALTFATLKDALAKGINAVATGGMTLATNIAAGAQWALNAAFLASPIGWIVLGLGAIVGAMVLLYNNVDSVRSFFDGAWAVIKLGAGYVIEIIQKMGSYFMVVGELFFNYVTMPFQIGWAVAKELGSALWGIIEPLFGTSDASKSTADSMNFLTTVFNNVITGLNYLISAIKGAVAWIQSIASSVGSAIGKLFSGDFSGAVDSITGAGEKAAGAYSEAFKKEMDKQKWSDATSAMTKAISSTKEIKLQVGIESKDNVNDELDKYKSTMAEIDELKNRQSGNSAMKFTDEDKQKLQELEDQANKSSAQIGKLAPETRTNMHSVVNAAGELEQVWDINIDKAKQFANSGNTDQLKGQIKQYSDAIGEQATQIANATTAQKAKQFEIDKETDPKKRQELTDKYNEEKKLIETNKTALVESLKQGAINGLLTEEAIAKVGTALGISSEEAKKMALGEVLKDAMAKGVITETQIGKIASQFGKTKEEVKAMIEEQKKSTAEAEKTANAALSIGDAYAESSKKAKEAADKNAGNLAGLMAQRKSLKANGATAEQLKENQEQIDAELKAGREQAKAFEESDATIKLAHDKVYGEKKKDKKAGNDNLVNLDIAYLQELSKIYAEQDKLEGEARKRANANAIKILEDKKKAIASSDMTEKEKLTATLATEQEIYKLQEKAELDAIEEKTKQSIVKNRQALVQKLGAEKDNKKIYDEYEKQRSNIESDSGISDEERLDKTAKLDEEYFRKLLANSKATAVTKTALEGGFQAARVIGEKEAETEIADVKNKYRETEKTAVSENTKKLNELELKEQKELLDLKLKNSAVYSKKEIGEKKKLQLALLELEFKDTLEKPADKRTEKELEQYKEYLAKKQALDTEASLAIANLETDEAKRKLDTDIINATDRMQKELTACQEGEEAKRKIIEKSEQEILKLRTDYIKENNLAYKVAMEFQKGLMEAFTKTEDKQATESAETKKKELTKEKADLEAQLRANTITYKEYAKKINDLNRQMQEADEVASKRHIDIMKAINGGLGTSMKIMYDMVQKEFNKTMDKNLAKMKFFVKDSSKEGVKFEMQWGKIWQATKEVAAEGIALMTAAAGEAIAQNANVGKAVLSTMLTTVQSVVNMIGVKILAEALATPASIASFGAVGFVEWALMMTAINTALSVAKAGIGAETGYLPNKKDYNNYVGKSDTKHVMVSPDEAIIPSDITKREMPLLAHLFAGGTSEEFYNSNIPNPATVAKIARMDTTAIARPPQTIINTNLSAQADLMNRMDKQLDKERRISVRTASEHTFSPLTIKKDVITAEVISSHNKALTKF